MPVVPGGVAANTGTTGFAQLTSDESGPFTAVTASDTANSGNVPVAEIAVVNGSATAVWEVINTNPNANENLRFAVYTSYTPAANFPPPGTITVNLSFAASPTSFTAGAGSVGSSTLPMPRFVPDAFSARDLLVITAGNCSPGLSIVKQHSGNFIRGRPAPLIR